MIIIINKHSHIHISLHFNFNLTLFTRQVVNDSVNKYHTTTTVEENVQLTKIIITNDDYLDKV